jgi:membrane protein
MAKVTPSRQRPLPDEAPLAPDEQPTPQPERREPKLPEPRLRDLSFRDWRAIFTRAGKGFLDDNCMMLASALAYSTFFAIPAVLLVAVGVFTLVASPSTISTLIHHLDGVIPPSAQQLLSTSLSRASSHPRGSVLATAIGFVLALWAVTGAMNSYMTAINLAYNRKDRRNFVKKRWVALKMAAIMVFAFVLVAVLLMFGPVISSAIASHAGGADHVIKIAWWAAQWPILFFGLLAAFATLLYLGPDVDLPKWEFLTPGSVIAVLLWLAASAGFAVYTATFASYNKTWGSLAAVIVMLTWLWITGMALLLGAEINAESERSRRLRTKPV